MISRHDNPAFVASTTCNRVSGRSSGRRAASLAGFSLIELMVALALGLLILAGMVALFASTSFARGEIDKTSRQIENGRYALQVVGDEIRHAGFYGPLINAPAVPATVPDPCSTVVTEVTSGLGLPLQGYAPATVAAAPSCLQSAAVGLRVGTAIVAVRRASAAGSAPAFTAGEFNMQASGCPGDGVSFVVGSVVGTFVMHKTTSALSCKPLGTAPLADIAPLYVRIFFVSNCSGADCSAAGADTVPTLKRMDMKPDGTRPITPIVDGIENLQIEYGLDGDLNGSPETFTAVSAPPSTVANSANVMAVRIYLLARNIDVTNGYTDTKTYSLGGVSVTPGGSFRRHAYSELVRLNNPAGRRE